MLLAILRPDGPGSETNIDTQFPAAGAHWEKVSEAVCDEDTTYVENKSGADGVYQRDLFDCQDPTGLSGTIQSVTVHSVTKHNASGGRAAIRTHGVVYEGSAVAGSAWMQWSEEWVNNPFTGQPWTWAEINDLEIGIALSGSVATPDWSKCTQLYAEILYGLAGTTIEPQVVASSDDCRVWLNFGTWAISPLTYATQLVGYSTVNSRNNGGGMRYLNVTLPPEAIITRAYLVMTCNANFTHLIKSVIVGEAADNAATFSTLADYQTRRGIVVGGPNDNNITVASVNWDYIHSWVLNTEYQSPDISDIIQEIIDRPGWASGNSLVIFWDDHANRSEQTLQSTRPAYSFNGSAPLAPKLYIEYGLPVVLPTVTTNPASNIEPTKSTPNGNLDDDGNEACDCGFEYGETTDYGTTTDTESKTTGETFSQGLLGLKGGTVYHFRAIATNSAGTSYGADRTFHTEALSAAAHQALGKGYPLSRAEL